MFISHVFPQHCPALHSQLTLWLPSAFLPIAWGMICDSVYHTTSTFPWSISQELYKKLTGAWFPSSEVQPVLRRPRDTRLPPWHRPAVQVNKNSVAAITCFQKQKYQRQHWYSIHKNWFNCLEETMAVQEKSFASPDSVLFESLTHLGKVSTYSNLISTFSQNIYFCNHKMFLPGASKAHDKHITLLKS